MTGPDKGKEGAEARVVGPIRDLYKGPDRDAFCHILLGFVLISLEDQL